VQGSEGDVQGIELSLRDYAAILVRHRWLFAAVFLTSLAAVVAWTAASPTEYQSTATVVLRTNNNQQLFPSVGPSQRSQFVRSPAAELEYARSTFFGAQAAQRSPALATVAPRYDEGDLNQSSQLSFVGTAGDPFEAQDAASAWAELYLELRAENQAGEIRATIEGVEALVADLEIEKDELLEPLKPIEDALLQETDSDTISRLTTQRLSLRQSLEDELLPITLQLRTLSQDLSNLRIAAGYVDRPDISARISIEAMPGRKVAPQVARNLALAPILGLMLATGAALLNESFRGVINNAGDITSIAPGVPILTQIPEFPRRIEEPLDLAANPGTPYAQAFERVVSSLLYERLLGPKKQMSVLVTSSVSGEGKTTVASHLALRLDATPATTILLDGDLRRPDVHQTFGQPQAKRGLSHLLQERASLVTHLHPIARAKRVRALFAGAATDNAAALLRQAFPAAVESLRGEYDLLIVDAPPVLAVTDAEVMAHSVDGVIVVVRAGKTSRAQLSETIRKLSGVDAHLIGFVLVAVKASAGYGYNYSYAYDSADRGQLSYSPEVLGKEHEESMRANERIAAERLQTRLQGLPVADLHPLVEPSVGLAPPAKTQPAQSPPPKRAQPSTAPTTTRQVSSRPQQAQPQQRPVATQPPVTDKARARRKKAEQRNRAGAAAASPPATRVAAEPSAQEQFGALWLSGIEEPEPWQRRPPSDWADDIAVVGDSST